jgi:hypothetical protein
MAKRDYPGIKRKYVEGVTRAGVLIWPTLDELAEEHKVDPPTLRRRASAEQWVEARNDFRTKQARARQAARVKKLGEEGAHFDLKILRLAETQAAMIDVKLQSLHVKRGNKFGPSDSEEIRKLSVALRNVQAVGRIALGEDVGAAGVPPLQPGEITVRVVRADGGYSDPHE